MMSAIKFLSLCPNRKLIQEDRYPTGGDTAMLVQSWDAIAPALRGNPSAPAMNFLAITVLHFAAGEQVGTGTTWIYSWQNVTAPITRRAQLQAMASATRAKSQARDPHTTEGDA